MYPRFALNTVHWKFAQRHERFSQMHLMLPKFIEDLPRIH